MPSGQCVVRVNMSRAPFSFVVGALVAWEAGAGFGVRILGGGCVVTSNAPHVGESGAIADVVGVDRRRLDGR